MNTPAIPQEIAELLEILCLGELQNSQAERLEQLVRSSPGDARHYVRFVYMNAVLERFEGADPKREEQLLLAHLPSAFVRQRSSVLTLVGGAFYSVARSPLVATLLVAALIYGVFGYLAWDLRSEKLPGGADGDGSIVATISDAVDVEWSSGSPLTVASTREKSIHPGEPLKIDSGTMELELDSGTKLVVEGPADWSISNSNSVSLRIGKLFARVPEQAIGFTVETPTARIVDLGTEFEVETDKQGSTEVQVLKGKVELRTGVNRRDDSSTTEILAAGTARRIEPAGKNGGVVVREIAPTPNRFIHPSAPLPARLIRVEGAYASSTYGVGDLDVDHLIRGDGLKGDRHSAGWVRTMWGSNYGQVKNVFVLFDLGRPTRLDSMKVWNFNNSNRGPWTGVKQADIYVSTTGKGDPLSQSSEWKLIAADQQFAPGTDRDDYDTPMIIQLGNVEARFAAIVIDAAHVRPPGSLNPEGTQDCVGLSEVQFFGSRVKASAQRD